MQELRTYGRIVLADIASVRRASISAWAILHLLSALAWSAERAEH